MRFYPFIFSTAEDRYYVAEISTHGHIAYWKATATKKGDGYERAEEPCAMSSTDVVGLIFEPYEDCLIDNPDEVDQVELKRRLSKVMESKENHDNGLLLSDHGWIPADVCDHCLCEVCCDGFPPFCFDGDKKKLEEWRNEVRKGYEEDATESEQATANESAAMS